jgi:protein-S-isoprenylcysteine O-methyltransferase Ste14
MNPRHLIATYLIAQAAGTAAWWMLLLAFPASMHWFQPSGWPTQTLLGFWLSDALLLIGGSLVVAGGVLSQKTWAMISIWSLAAATWYPTLYCIGVSVLTDEAWIASAMMVCLAGLTLAMATIHGNAVQAPATIRVTPMTTSSALTWTFMQTLIFWSVFLWIIPQGIFELGMRLGLNPFDHRGQLLVAACLFGCASLLGAWSAVTMAIAGNGTPLPTATAPNLVMSGPYRYVRNPMALAGIMQGVAVGWAMGSWPVISYAFAGAFVWHWLVRPVEEADLQERFQEQYSRYRDSVRLWIPVSKSPRN